MKKFAERLGFMTIFCLAFIPLATFAYFILKGFNVASHTMTLIELPLLAVQIFFAVLLIIYGKELY